MSAYEILWKDKTSYSNKREKWQRISKSKLHAYLKSKYSDPQILQEKEMSLASGMEVETDTFKCRNTELVAQRQLRDAELLRSDNTGLWVYAKKTPSTPLTGGVLHVYGINKEVGEYSESLWPPIGFKYRDWEFFGTDKHQNLGVLGCWYNEQRGESCYLTDPESRPPHEL